MTKMAREEILSVGIAIAAQHAGMLANNENVMDEFLFGAFGADSIHNCYKYVEIANKIVDNIGEYVYPDGVVDTEAFRYAIEREVEETFKIHKEEN